jgi:hypothetical protein
MVWYGMVWYGMVWYGMVWYGMVWYSWLALHKRVFSLYAGNGIIGWSRKLVICSDSVITYTYSKVRSMWLDRKETPSVLVIYMGFLRPTKINERSFAMSPFVRKGVVRMEEEIEK